MSQFNKTRFFEGLAAAIIGGVAIEKGKEAILGTSKADDSKKFHKALMVAQQSGSLSERDSESYLSRIAKLSEYNKPRYMEFILQPSRDRFDANETSAAILDHAKQNDRQWVATLAAFSLDVDDPWEMRTKRMMESYERARK